MRTLVLATIFLCSCEVGEITTSTVPDCATYCSQVTASCTAANSQYESMDTCMASCAHLPVGTLADTSGNTLGCRLYHAGNAAMDPATHCVHAGPGGGGHCGAPCEGFCSLVTAECPAQYPDEASCMSTCGGYTATPAYSTGVTGGNSLACRLFHATAASTDPGTHCAHTASSSAPCM